MSTIDTLRAARTMMTTSTATTRVSAGCSDSTKPRTLGVFGGRTRTSFVPGDQRNVARYRGKLRIPTHAHPLVVRLYKEMNRQQTTIGEVAARSGVSRQVIWDWRNRSGAKVDALDACFNVLGMKLAVVPEGWKL